MCNSIDPTPATGRLCLFHPVARCVLLTPDETLVALFRGLWPENRVVWEHYAVAAKAMERLFGEPPQLLIVDDNLGDQAGRDLVNAIKSENVYRQVPVVLCVEEHALGDDGEGLMWTKIEADDFLVKPVRPSEAVSRLTLTLCRAARSLDANPLTRLPGNTSIIQRIQELIEQGQQFALAYCDLDHFKSFNDRYGFSRGDEALMMTARIIVNTIRSLNVEYSFVGHVGGDDFVFIVPVESAEQACARIIENFDAIVPNFYDPEDRAHKGIISTDRQGAVREFPVMAISIAVVVNRGAWLNHYGEAVLVAAQLKKKAKENPRSSYVIDRRDYETRPPQA